MKKEFKVLLQIVIILALWGCSNTSEFTGGCTEVGNGYVTGSLQMSSDSNAVVTLTTVDYYSGMSDSAVLRDTLITAGEFHFRNLSAGEYRLWIGTGSGEQFLSDVITVANDTTYISSIQTQKMGAISYSKTQFPSDDQPIGVYILGTDLYRPFATDTEGNLFADSLPAGTYPILFRSNDSSVSEIVDTLTVISEDTVEVTADFTLIRLPFHSKSQTVHTFYTDNDTLWCGGPDGFGYFINGEWDFESDWLLPVLGIEIVDVERVKSRFVLASVDLLLRETETGWDTLQVNDTIVELYQANDSLWILTKNRVLLYSDDVVVSLQIESIFDPQQSLTSFAVSKTGDIWVGTDKQGLYYYDGNWTKVLDSQFSNWENSKLTNINFDREGTLWVSSEGEGLYYYLETWSRLLMDEVGGKISTTIQMSSDEIWIVANDGSFLRHKNNLITPITQLTFQSSATEQVLTVIEDSDGDLLIASNGQGVYTLSVP